MNRTIYSGPDSGLYDEDTFFTFAKKKLKSELVRGVMGYSQVWHVPEYGATIEYMKSRSLGATFVRVFGREEDIGQLVKLISLQCVEYAEVGGKAR